MEGLNSSATDVELVLTHVVADRVKEFLSSELGWPEPMIVMSGNGHHLVYRLEPTRVNPETVRTVKAYCKD